MGVPPTDWWWYFSFAGFHVVRVCSTPAWLKSLAAAGVSPRFFGVVAVFLFPSAVVVDAERHLFLNMMGVGVPIEA